MSHVSFRRSTMHRVFDRCPSLQGFQICHPLKTSGLALLQDWAYEMDTEAIKISQDMNVLYVLEMIRVIKKVSNPIIPELIEAFNVQRKTVKSVLEELVLSFTSTHCLPRGPMYRMAYS
ncbi:hypothetical protein TNCV_302821 [Trichonephila clavipes]|nr:hypothetical protein TNCV_302821 [Trichonephila clavipes]